MQRNWNSCTLLVGMKNGETAVENGIVVSQKMKKKFPCDSAIPFWGIPKRMEQELKSYLYTHVHSNIMHNSQMIEASQVSIKGRMIKLNSNIHKMDY